MKILATVARYHALQKDLADNILPRFFALQEIATAIDKRVGGSTKLALKTALHFAAKLDDQDLTTLESLAKRARAKADYLDILKQHYRTNKDELADAAEFWKRVTAKQATEGKQIGLRPSVNLEKADPLHRSFEGDLPVVTDWWSAIVEGRTTAPLWLHLETTTLCQDPDTAKSMDTVPYMDGKGDSTKANVFAIRHIARLVQAQMNGEPTTWEWKPFDTGWIKPGMSGKSQTSLGTKTRDKPQLTIDRGYSLAYVWTGKKELFAALHNPTAKAKQPTERFHHSSFNSGGMVLCAGMIAAKQGLVTFLSNDSGHYKPDGDHLAKLAKFLHKRNLFHPTALIIDVESDIDYQNPLTVPQFLARPLRL